MVLKRKQYHSFNGFNLTSFPRGLRSSRGRGRKSDDRRTCAFELLASLAGKLLQESESSSASSYASGANYQPLVGDEVFKNGHVEGGRPVKSEFNHKTSYDESEFSSSKKDGKCENDSILERSSVVTKDILEKPSSDVKPVVHKNKTVFESSPIKVEGGSPGFGEASGGHMENAYGKARGENGTAAGGLTIDNSFSCKDPVELCTDFPAMTNAGNNVKLQSRRVIVSNASIMRHRNCVKQLCIRDNDEKISRFDKQVTKPKAIWPASRIGDQRFRKLLTSKFWKVAPKLKDCEVSKVGILDGGMKSFHHKRKLYYSRDRYKHDALYKRRKFSGHRLVVTSDGGFSSESVCNSPEKGLSGNKNEPAALFTGSNATSSSANGRRKSFLTKNSDVKFSIKSFRIPELFIEVPETATVGSLKRTVMEAVTAILVGGLRVGVLLHGKKVRDDHRTLSQSGITSSENLDTLGFSLEPSVVQSPSPVCIEEPSAPLLTDASQLVTRSPAPSVLHLGVCDAIVDPSSLMCLDNNIESGYGVVSSHTDIVTDNTLSDSRALVPIPPPVNEDALVVVPVTQKPKRSDLAQRRTRRPFSVSEVEALVHAVEELGTGRWRDVKLRCFEDADHRTYVDLKDKWKTLVHTAKIAPQQRRGEPVPQELLDRVLVAHAYWSHHQAKQHGKNQAAVLKLADGAPSPVVTI